MNNKLHGLTVLLVDDDLFNRRFMQRNLENLHATVLLAENGEEAIQLIGQNELDVILMDLQMPVMDGFTAINYLKTEKKSTLPIIALTGSDAAEDRKKALRLGCANYLIKPLSNDALLEAIYEAVQKDKSIVQLIDEEEGGNNALYRLDKLESISRGDQQFVEKMVRMLLQEMPASLTMLKQGLQEEDYSRIKSAAHKMKPSVQLMGMETITDTVQQLEDNAGAQTKLEEIPAQLNQVVSVCEKVLNALKVRFAMD